ncbi:hypothetical protein OGAPHI_006752 [Ogataea philodendri]|uniref:Uncharacterized protein n=1 Tax=Ogataea philodendri TaxID=1378263 RepID=A0A9P8NXJ8_9ASCO|nr:uncharacterized protein OGAPHI_006752 [Ogataea philodendri]KAH3661345.1 hypothetical protein OGAPHI_006752 [Ogataea philodendri]
MNVVVANATLRIGLTSLRTLIGGDFSCLGGGAVYEVEVDVPELTESDRVAGSDSLFLEILKREPRTPSFDSLWPDDPTSAGLSYFGCSAKALGNFGLSG